MLAPFFIWASGVMVATLDLGSSAEMRESSSLSLPTNLIVSLAKAVKHWIIT